MKDNFSLIAAAAGGFMLSVALTGILRGAPVASLQGNPGFHSLTVATLQPAPKTSENVEFFGSKTGKK
ncbi:hypothetical protein [Brasilonema bromeliae]|uniref:Uncharacterized protein n=1 Tax=Brasilonema bromeliae SPC951 TaxID=385972 RepID=A0ABX1P6S4_9CYAN|nr:hypothetical protein [Brasilonema bromeliae]NMG20085.1 hypothetical protein [Brasilonema bromeliae SPC951]